MKTILIAVSLAGLVFAPARVFAVSCDQPNAPERNIGTKDKVLISVSRTVCKSGKMIIVGGSFAGGMIV